MVLVRQPCVQAFTRLVKVWKPDCGHTKNWCVGYERRTHYYTTYKERYEPHHITRYKCCTGWQANEDGNSCNNRLCSSSLCYNGGQCNGGYTPSCSCPPGYQGARCQYGDKRGPKSEEIVRGPKSVEIVKGPKSVEIVRGPKSVEIVRGPKSVEIVRGPKPVDIVRGPKSVEIVRGPKSVEIVRAPESEEIVRGPKSVEIVGSPILGSPTDL
ncbi:Multiple epidermal growth factor-like domains protein 6 [Bulinus truncatus]|nr:Multiple epidermal growth factor-like domains protein 6 [Bulinus truncatus]